MYHAWILNHRVSITRELQCWTFIFAANFTLKVSEQGLEEAPIPYPLTFQFLFRSTPRHELPEGAVRLNMFVKVYGVHCKGMTGGESLCLHCKWKAVRIQYTCLVSIYAFPEMKRGPAFVAGGGQTRRAESGMGVNILEDERDRIALLQ
jgi:hypothetical protein